MKKLFLIVAVMAATVSANAQAEPGRFSIQPHTGGTGGIFSSAPKTSTIGLPSDFDTNVIAGNSIGVDFEYQINKWLSAAAGVNYVETGNAWKDKDVNNVKYKDVKIQTGYITVPLVANFYVHKGLALKTGVQFAYLTNAKEMFSIEDKTDKVTRTYITSTDIKDNLNKFDISIPVGISYEFKVPIVIDLRYNIGLSKIGKSDSAFKDSRSNTCMLTLGYKFKL